MKLDVSVKLNMKAKEANKIVQEAAKLAMRDTVVDIAGDSVKMSPILTGNNRRSIAFEVSGFDIGEGIVNQDKIEGAVYSTSGYGGFLETGTVKMPARPYMKPALDKHAPKFPQRMKERLSGTS